jgi:hypothetical protein
MAADRYTRVVLTVIAAALVYLCVVLTPAQTVLQAQSPQPGTISPAEVTIIGWRVPQTEPMRVQVVGDVRVTGRVQAEQPQDLPDRVVLVGWEEGSTELARGARRALDPEQPGLPVRSTPR